MGTYNTPEKNRRPLPKSVMTSIRDFASTFLDASEIEWIDLEKMGEKVGGIKKGTLLRTFFLINATLNQTIEDIRIMRPEGCPPLKEFKKKTATNLKKSSD